MAAHATDPAWTLRRVHGEAWRSFNLYEPTPDHAAARSRPCASSSPAKSSPKPNQSTTADEYFNHELFRKAGELGLLGLTLPEAYGGARVSTRSPRYR